LFVLMMSAVCAIPALAQTQEVKPKPPMLTYVANWQVPRANFPDMEKASPIEDILKKALADGTIVGYGNDMTLVHTVDGETHDNWWSAMSMAGLVKVLEQIRAGGVPAPLASATKHWDNVYVSRYYNWKPGAYKGGFVHVSVYKFKADSPDDAYTAISEHLIVPTMEKLLADGTILEYELDTEAIHTSAPGTFAVVYVTPTAEGLDTVNKAIRDSQKAHPLGIDGFEAMTDYSGHRDELYKGDGIFK
jgi:hypothetical protein